MRILLCITLSFVFTTFNQTHAQHTFIQWEAKPSLHTIPDDFSTYGAVMLEDYRYTDYKTDAKDEITVHVEVRRLVKVLNDNGVESFNKIYIRVSPTAKVLKVKARTITPEGKVIDLPADKILDVEEEGTRYKKFAMEGIQKGSEIEYYSLIEYPLYTFGMEYFLFSTTPIQKARFGLSVPEHLFFDVKGYNGFKTGKDTVVGENRITYAEMDNILPIDGEKYGYTDPFTPNVQYKLSYNYAKDKSVRMNTWSNLAKNVYTNYHEFSDKEIKALDAYLKSMKLPKGASVDEQIKQIEHYVKSNIHIEESTISDDANKIEQIVKTKVSGKFGAIRLMLGVLERSGLKPSLVFPSKRDETTLDESFENFRLLDELIFYFSETDKFLNPIALEYRYPLINPLSGGTKGIFINETKIGNFSTALATFDTIPLLPFEASSSNVELELKFNKSVDTIILDTRQILTGYSASPYRSIYSYIGKDKHDDFSKDIIGNIAKSDSITNIVVENMDYTNTYDNRPLIISGKIISSELIEKAGKNWLIKIGEVIGSQEQMYEDKKRMLPIVIQYPHVLDRVIKFEIPEGYKVKNLNDLNFDVTDEKESGKATMGFVSTYKLNGNELTIHLNEFYKEIYYPKEMIETFRKVINAAADFNKVVLLLEKL